MTGHDVTDRKLRSEQPVAPPVPTGTPDGAASAPAAEVPDRGAVRNTLLQLATQATGLVLTGGLTLYLVRALGASGYGLYALAVSVGTLVVLPASLGLPMAVARFLADHRDDKGQVRAILSLGLRLQLPGALLGALTLFAAGGLIAQTYGHPSLAWPLRWVGLSVATVALFNFLTAVSTAIRQGQVTLLMAVMESVSEVTVAVGLVLAGAGVAGAAAGRGVGYAIGAGVGLFLTIRLLGGRSSSTVARRVRSRALLSYAGAMFIVDLGVSAIAQVDLLLVGALLTTAAVGTLSAVLRILIVAGYLGVAVANGVAPRLSLGGGGPDTRVFSRALRYLVVVQGVVIAPMLIWGRPIVDLLLGPGYSGAAEILRVLTVQAFVATPSALISVSVTYLGEGRRRVAIVLSTLAGGALAIYVLVRTVGLVGAAIGDDMIVTVYLVAHLWIFTRLVSVDLRPVAWSCVRTVAAAAAMALPLLVAGTARLSVGEWLGGGLLGVLAYCGVLLLTGEFSVAEVRSAAARLRQGGRPKLVGTR